MIRLVAILTNVQNWLVERLDDNELYRYRYYHRNHKEFCFRVYNQKVSNVHSHNRTQPNRMQSIFK